MIHLRAHKSVNHSIGEYVRADVHTNTVEGVWSPFKRSIIGAYHQISVKHMPKYLDEQAWRFDNRHNAYLFRDTVLKLLAAKPVPFKVLVKCISGCVFRYSSRKARAGLRIGASTPPTRRARPYQSRAIAQRAWQSAPERLPRGSRRSRKIATNNAHTQSMPKSYHPPKRMETTF